MWRAWTCAWTRGGNFYVLEVNPLPGLTPDYSDLCLIAKAANIDYGRSLIGEILSGGLKRLREKRRAEAREAEAARVAPTSNGNGESQHGKGEKARPPKRPPLCCLTDNETTQPDGRSQMA